MLGSDKLKNQIESLLFVSNRPLKPKTLAKVLEAGEGEIIQALKDIQSGRNGTGIVLLEGSDGWQLATNSENSSLVKSFLNADLREKLTEATLEVLAIIAYRQPIAKSEIEAIRGVNSQYSIRALLIRGLVERVPNPHDARSFLYQVTTEFMQHLGLQSVSDLEDFDKLTEKIKLPETPGLNREASDSAPADESLSQK